MRGDSALCLLPQAEGPEIVGEVADLLIRCRGIRRVLCGARVGDDLLLSARTQLNCENATDLLQTTLDGLGAGGGHEHRAGGKIPNVGGGKKVTNGLERELRRRWFGACGSDDAESSYLIPREGIFENL